MHLEAEPWDHPMLGLFLKPDGQGQEEAAERLPWFDDYAGAAHPWARRPAS